MIEQCNICGNKKFVQQNVLWMQLISDWKLSDYELEYINKQQGCCCAACNSNIRSMALASAITNVCHFDGLFAGFVKKWKYRNFKILEINAAGNLHELLRLMKYHTFVEFPECDMLSMNKFNDDTFDFVIHSDTLEHVTDPVKGLRECCRVLKPNGHCIFTIPIIVDRLSRSRKGMPESYHGNTNIHSEDFVVHTEFGADAWKYVLEAGFKNVSIHALDYPAGLAIEAIK